MRFHISLLLMLVVFVTLSSCAQNYQRLAKDYHNKLRKRHRAPPLTLSEDLNNRAVKCAQYYANKGKSDHSCPYKNGAGENLWGPATTHMSNEAIAISATELWYAEVTKYDYSKNSFQYAAGHFSQLVWKSSKLLGFGTAQKGKKYFACALYSPPGNYAGRFKDNVLRP